MMKKTMKTDLKTFQRTCKTVSRKICINRLDKIKISNFSCTCLVIKRTMKFLSVVTQTYIYQIPNTTSHEVGGGSGVKGKY